MRLPVVDQQCAVDPHAHAVVGSGPECGRCRWPEPRGGRSSAPRSCWSSRRFPATPLPQLKSTASTRVSTGVPESEVLLKYMPVNPVPAPAGARRGRLVGADLLQVGDEHGQVGVADGRRWCARGPRPRAWAPSRRAGRGRWPRRRAASGCRCRSAPRQARAARRLDRADVDRRVDAAAGEGRAAVAGRAVHRREHRLARLRASADSEDALGVAPAPARRHSSEATYAASASRSARQAGLRRAERLLRVPRRSRVASARYRRRASGSGLRSPAPRRSCCSSAGSPGPCRRGRAARSCCAGLRPGRSGPRPGRHGRHRCGSSRSSCSSARARRGSRAS